MTMNSKCAALIGVVMATTPVAAVAGQPAAWTQPAEPFQITDDIYYVGSKGLAAYLIVSGRQAILLDGAMDDNVETIENNIKSLGFALDDVKIIINSHAHFDHAGGIARLKADTGAKLAAMAEDKSALERGRHEGDSNYVGRFKPVAVDQTLADGDTISVGSVTLTATLTPGHTKGCTTWSMTSPDAGKQRRVVFPCSLSVAGNRLVGNKSYPGIVEDYRRSFELMRAMQADVVLPAHPELADIFGRKGKRDAGDKEAFVDRQALPEMVNKFEAAFEKALDVR